MKNKGQSLVEITLVMPILIILLAGLTEFGWYANHYMILLEVSRVGARTATVQQNVTHPLYWEAPENGLLNASIVPSVSDPNYDSWLARYRNCDATDSNASIGFYNFLSCVMRNSMNPLNISGFEPGTDSPEDIIISSFAIQSLSPSQLPLEMRNKVLWPVSGDVEQLIVVGRYPSNANECPAAEMRDPFDYIRDSYSTSLNWNNRKYSLELSGYDIADESQLGFTYSGKYINKWGCRGSEFSTSDIERLINLQNFGLVNQERDYIPKQGIVLVEIHWKHETLSQFVGFAPVLSPIFAMLGYNDVMSTWAMFPLPQVEPNIDLPPEGTF